MYVLRTRLSTAAVLYLTLKSTARTALLVTHTQSDRIESCNAVQRRRFKLTLVV